MLSLQQIKAPIKKEMQSFEGYFNETLKSAIPLLRLITNYLLRRKGKQLRPMFVFFAARLNGEVNQSTYNAASFIELLHTATLIHDDVVDESYERRGFLSINALWKSKVAVLLGDFLLSRGLLLAVEKNEYELLGIMSTAVRAMSEGELMQIEKARKLNITEEVYFDIIRKKTATLIAACAASGAKSVQADDETVEEMRKFGEFAGIAFQIRDDLFDYQKTNIAGKPTGNDIKEKKMTLPLIYALNQTSGQKRKRILRIVKHNKKNAHRIHEVVNFVKENGGLDYARRKMTEYKTHALHILNNYPESEVREALKNLVEFTVQRKK